MFRVGSAADSYDVVVVGYGCAGAAAAIAAADAGATVLLLEKSPHLGGLSLLSSGYMRVADDAPAAAEYLAATSGGRVPQSLITELADGMVRLPSILASWCERVGSSCESRFRAALAPHETADLYDWPGREALGWAGINAVGDFEGYPWAAKARGNLLMRTLELNIVEREIDVWLESAAVDLLRDAGEVVGVAVSRGAAGSVVEVGAVGGVVLATAGFEFSQAMLQSHLELPVVYPVGHPWNTGDGIRMAERAGAELWHMWHFHGSYGFKFDDYDFAFRHHLGGARHDDRLVAWIVVDQNGRRFMNEVPRAPQDTSWRDLAHLEDETGRFDRVPSWLIFDETARQLGPIGKTTWSRTSDRYDWSDDNRKEIDRGWIRAAPTLEDLAATIGVPAASLRETVTDWNRSVIVGSDPLGRPPGVCAPVDAPPFHAVEVWPVCTNTQGGPRHDEFQRVLDHSGEPISGLYAVGELGSFFGHIYLLGGNLTEAAVGGTLAGALAAQRAETAPDRHHPERSRSGRR